MAGWAAGVFTRARNWVNDKNGAINPQAALFDQEDDNFASGLNNCVTKDGLNKPSATMDWNAQILKNVGNAMFNAERITTSQSMPVSSTTDVIFNTTTTNTGAGYSTVTGIFTAPLAGTYHFDALIGLSSGGTNCVLGAVYFSVNNNTSGTGLRYDLGYGTPGAQYSNTGNGTQFAGSITLVLAAGDTVRVKWIAGTSGAGTNSMPTGSKFMGYMLG